MHPIEQGKNTKWPNLQENVSNENIFNHKKQYYVHAFATCRIERPCPVRRSFEMHLEFSNTERYMA